jgi:hypothetical protein
MEVAVDFDGTVVTHEFPDIGKDIGAVPILKKLVEKKHKIILYTVRSHGQNDFNTDVLQDAVDWFERNGIPLYGVNESPGQEKWTNSPKVYADLYIDDSALGCPLITNHELAKRPYVDWGAVEKLLVKDGII